MRLALVKKVSQMTRKLFVVCIQQDSVWFDAAEFDDEYGKLRAFGLCKELRVLGLNAKVAYRWISVNPLGSEA